MTSWKMPDFVRSVLLAGGYTPNQLDEMDSDLAENIGRDFTSTMHGVNIIAHLNNAGLLNLPGTWTDQPPTEPGWYWFRDTRTVCAHDPQPIELKSDGVFSRPVHGDIDSNTLRLLWPHIEWFTTPIGPPVERKTDE